MQINTGLTGKHFSSAQDCLSFELSHRSEKDVSHSILQVAYRPLLVKECLHGPLVPTTRHHEGNHVADWQYLQMERPSCVPNPFIDTHRPQVSALELMVHPEVTVRKTSFSPPSNRKNNHTEQGPHRKETNLSSTVG